METSKQSRRPPAPSGYQLTRWKKVLVGVAALLVVSGGALAFLGGPGEKRASDRSRTAAARPAHPPVEGLGAQPRSVLPRGRPRVEIEVERRPAPGGVWSHALLRGGISFFAAFALAYAFRAFLRLAVIFAGVWAASLFLLDGVGWIDVHWDVIDQQFRTWASGLGDQFRSVQTLVTGSLPSAGLAGLGLLAGFKKR